MQGNGDLGSSAAVWNWQATGVSRSLWNMVRGCLRSGMPRDSTLAIIRAIQNGLPDEQTEEEDEVEEEDELEQEQVVPQNSTPAVAQPSAPVTDNNAKRTVCYHLYIFCDGF